MRRLWHRDPLIFPMQAGTGGGRHVYRRTRYWTWQDDTAGGWVRASGSAAYGWPQANSRPTLDYEPRKSYKSHKLKILSFYKKYSYYFAIKHKGNKIRVANRSSKQRVNKASIWVSETIGTNNIQIWWNPQIDKRSYFFTAGVTRMLLSCTAAWAWKCKLHSCNNIAAIPSAHMSWIV